MLQEKWRENKRNFQQMWSNLFCYSEKKRKGPIEDKNSDHLLLHKLRPLSSLMAEQPETVSSSSSQPSSSSQKPSEVSLKQPQVFSTFPHSEKLPNSIPILRPGQFSLFGFFIFYFFIFLCLCYNRNFSL